MVLVYSQWGRINVGVTRAEVSDEGTIVEAACALLRDVGNARARELVVQLRAKGIEIDKTRLNSILYRHLKTTALLTVTEGVWHCDAPTPRESATRPVAAVRLASSVPHPIEPVAEAASAALASSWPSPEQREIIDADVSAWQLVEAGPGTGKTAVAVARVAGMVNRGVPPAGILLVSFTRTAVAELRQRIAALVADVSAVAAVRITTLDAEAWNLGVNLTLGTVATKLAEGFDGNIATAIKLFQESNRDLLAWMAHTRHVIIDEAQDLVGARIELVLQILDHLPEACGATVFVDPGQAIYGFADADADSVATFPPVPFHERLTKEIPGLFTNRCLTKLYRSSSPSLRRVFEDGRRIVLQSGDGVARQAQLRALARGACEAVPPVADRLTFEFDELLLFRRRVEVLRASSYLSEKGVAHRLRMGDGDLGTLPWLGVLFNTEVAHSVNREEFNRLWDRAAKSPHLRGLEPESAWNILWRLASSTSGKAIDLHALRRHLARSRPSAEISQAEVGIRGPVLGTIHGSKGREAATVSLMISLADSETPTEQQLDAALDEEVRVTYVGTTRARSVLRIGGGDPCRGLRPLERSGRIFRIERNKPGRIQLEIGRKGDVDDVGSVAKSQWNAHDAQRTQQFLASYAGEVVPLTVTATDEAHEYTYSLHTSDGSPLGTLSQNVNRDLFSIARLMAGPRRKPPRSLPFASLIGLRTVAIGADDPRVAKLHEPWASSGIFLVPVIRALTTVTLPKKGRR